MKRYSIFHPYFMSFGSQDLYRDVALNWRGTAFLYLLVLLAILWVPRMVKVHNVFADFLDTDGSMIVQQVPDFVISNGEVSINKPMPYTITEPETKMQLVVIDTTGRINSLEDTKALALITKSKVLTRNSATETRTFDLSHVKYFRIDRQRLYSLMNVVRKWLAVILYPMAVLSSFVFRIVQALIYALIGMLFAKIAHVALGYKTLVRLAVIATTPAIILNTLLSLAGVSFAGLNLIYFVIAMAYLWFGTKAVSRIETPQQV